MNTRKLGITWKMSRGRSKKEEAEFIRNSLCKVCTIIRVQERYRHVRMRVEKKRKKWNKKNERKRKNTALGSLFHVRRLMAMDSEKKISLRSGFSLACSRRVTSHCTYTRLSFPCYVVRNPREESNWVTLTWTAEKERWTRGRVRE